jgi:hypothetical protein
VSRTGSLSRPHSTANLSQKLRASSPGFTEQLFAPPAPRGATGTLRRHTQHLKRTVTAILRERRANGGRRSLRSLLHEIDTTYE